MWLLSQSHKWIMQPYTSYEIRRELRVRESVHTGMVFDKKYFNIDTCKYDFDKLSSIHSSSLADEVITPGSDSVIRIQRLYDKWN